MSRVGKLPIKISSDVNIDISDSVVTVSGPKGSIQKEFNDLVLIEYNNSQVLVKPVNDSREAKAMWGTTRSIINGMVIGVKDGFKEELEINGVGYRANVKGKFLNLTLGKSHNTKIAIPDWVIVNTPKQTIITLESYDKQKLGQYVAMIRSQRPPEPYKGKGIRRKGEFVQKKEGKKG